MRCFCVFINSSNDFPFHGCIILGIYTFLSFVSSTSSKFTDFACTSGISSKANIDSSTVANKLPSNAFITIHFVPLLK